jgi:DNA-binding GntR family transcriptional regulator
MQALSQEVYDFLLQKLLRNKLLPGAALNRRQVAIDMKVSVAPVLEAMLQLEIEGFLQSIPRKGTYVRLITAEDVKGQLVVREAMECQAARLYCGDPVKRSLERLESTARKADLHEPGSMEGWISEAAFHRALVDLAGCPALTQEFDKVMRMDAFFTANKFLSFHDDMEKNSHERLVGGLLTTDPEHAEKLIRRHFGAAKEPWLTRVVV